MDRPIYETPQDLANEAEIVARVATSWGCDHVLKLSRAYGMDWAMVSETTVEAFAEVKDRDLTFGVIGGYYISVLKAKEARLTTATTGKPCYLAVRFSDGVIRVADFKDSVKAPVVEHGRHDRGDPYDIEPCVAIPWEAFAEL